MAEMGEIAIDFVEILDAEELLFRQVHPQWFEEGLPSAQAFYPTKKDLGRLSIACSSLTDPASAFVFYTTSRNLKSVGTWGLSVREVNDSPALVALPVTAPGNQSVTLPSRLACRKEPLKDDPAHGFIDYRSLSKRACELIGKVLMANAVKRGCLHTQ
jgi:hypothetical protein